MLVREAPSGQQTFAVYGLGLLYEVTDSVIYPYHDDQAGSTVALTDAAGSVVTDRMGYAPFGTLVVRKGTTTTPYLSGGQFGVETDPNRLLYMRARYYQPLLRRFISADPRRFAGGLHWYGYAGNIPVQFVDPAGLDELPALVEEFGGLVQRLPAPEPGSGEVVAPFLDPVDFLPGPAEMKAGFAVILGIEGLGKAVGREALETVGRKAASGMAPNPAVQTIEQRAADLVARNGGRNCVAIKTPNGRVNIDLQGKPHGGVNTPHVVEFQDNIIPSGPRAGQVGNRSPVGPTREATDADLRIVDHFLKSKGQ